jgi:hypothetical protein
LLPAHIEQKKRPRRRPPQWENHVNSFRIAVPALAGALSASSLAMAAEPSPAVPRVSASSALTAQVVDRLGNARTAALAAALRALPSDSSEAIQGWYVINSTAVSLAGSIRRLRDVAGGACESDLHFARGWAVRIRTASRSIDDALAILDRACAANCPAGWDHGLHVAWQTFRSALVEEERAVGLPPAGTSHGASRSR